MFGLVVWASACISSGVYLRAKCKGDPGRKAVALTFDDGPHPLRTPMVLDVLQKHGARAAFFVKGELAELYPDILRRMAEEGHIIGNHTYSHSGCFPLYGYRRMKEELKLCSRAIEGATGRIPMFFRPPFGVTNPTIARAVRKMGLETYGWSIRSFDTLGDSRNKVLNRVLNKLHNGAIILLHDDREDSAELTDQLFTGIKERGYSVLRADEI